MNFIPDKPGTTPGYFCTWGPQCQLRKNYDRKVVTPRCMINEDLLFGGNGMVLEHERIRGDLFFVLDDGWDVPYKIDPNTEMHEFGSLILNEERFPSFTGTPAERLKKINDTVKSFGWKGAGLWIAAQSQGETIKNRFDAEKSEAYWRARLEWTKFAQIPYWKVDWGFNCGCPVFRERLTRLGKEIYPELLIEHCLCIPPLNQNEGRFPGFGETDYNRYEDLVNIFVNSDIFRSYDITDPLSAATTFDRVAGLMKIKMNPDAAGIINCENEVYLAAAMGFAVGIMRSGFDKDRPEKLDEDVRAVNWQRIAPVFGNISGADCHTGGDIVFDSYYFEPGEMWYSQGCGKEICQGCPSVISRGIPLPQVSNYTEKTPLAAAARNPNGAVAITTMPRTTFKKTETPLADIEFEAGTDDNPIGVFGRYRQLTLVFNQSVYGKTVYAQDLAGKEAQDVTNDVVISDNKMIISGGLINKIGLSAASEGDVSDPGLLIKII